MGAPLAGIPPPAKGKAMKLSRVEPLFAMVNAVYFFVK
jgi:hypothetical protein